MEEVKHVLTLPDALLSTDVPENAEVEHTLDNKKSIGVVNMVFRVSQEEENSWLAEFGWACPIL
jgi:hypothetical protein